VNDVLLLTRIALRNLFGSFLNVIIGLIIFAGTLFFVMGGSLLSSMDAAMSRSIIGSVAGDAQVYSSKSKDPIAIFDNWNLPDLEGIPDFSKIKGPLLTIPNVKTVIPMGINNANVVYGNTVDLALEKLRGAVNKRIAGDHSAALKAQIESFKAHVRQIVTVIQGDYAKLSVVASKDSIDPQAAKDLQQASAPSFWQSFDSDPLNHLEFLENKIATLVPDADFIYLSYVGTDLDAFQAAFDRMKIVDGQAVPKGQRGMLLSKYAYEEQFKLKVAHRLDQIHEAITDEAKTIAKDPDLQDLVKQNRTQTREIILQLDPISTQKVILSLQGLLGSKETDLAKLLSLFLDTDDSNFAQRYKFFYDNLAPYLDLYRLRPGDMLTIKAYSKTGFVDAVNVKVYGTFQFKGLEKSGLAGALSLMDLMSFRDLYGYVTPEKIAETKHLEKEAGVKFVDRDQAESQLFGSDSGVSESHESTINDKTELGNVKSQVKSADLVNRVYSKDEIEKGVVLNAAIILKDPSQLNSTMKEIQALSDSQKLDLTVLSWQKAAGNIGQFVLVAKFILYFAVFIIFIVALVIINNAVMMATLQRVREIGTLRAIGAQRSFVLSMVLMETVMLGLVFGTLGVLLGSGLVGWMGHVGIPARNEFLYFFFSGPRLYPSLGWGSVVGAFAIVLVVTCISALYPAIMATRVSPVQAMQSED
jgi:ABC-type antimicrobial peptide transport system permease subunit